MDKPDSVMMPITTPVRYPTSQGEFAECFQLEICCHTRKQYKKTLYFATILTKISTLIALPDSLMGRLMDSAEVPQKKEKKDDDAEAGMTAQQVAVAIKLNASDDYGIDVEEMLEKFEKLALDGLVLVEGKPLHKIQVNEEMDPADLEKAMYVYLANFLMPLVMKDLTSV